jgi:hypothetical protein
MRMAHPLTYAYGRSFDPDEIKRLVTLFDEIWASLAEQGFGKDGRTAAERDRLASIILDLARDRQLGDLEITRTASRLMRERRRSRTRQRT